MSVLIRYFNCNPYKKKRTEDVYSKNSLSSIEQEMIARVENLV